jgi:hypothetical protein
VLVLFVKREGIAFHAVIVLRDFFIGRTETRSPGPDNLSWITFYAMVSREEIVLSGDNLAG